MNKELKDAWLKALRSGKYKQGKYALNTRGAFCCLGVLCDVGEKLGAFPVERNNGAIIGCSNVAQPGLNKALPEVKQNTVAAMNDNGKPFTEIAAWISKNVKASAAHKAKRK